MSEYKIFIKKILDEIDPYEEIDENTDLLDSGVLDSLTIVYLVTQIEEHYHFSIDEKLIVPNNFSSVSKIAKLIAKINN